MDDIGENRQEMTRMPPVEGDPGWWGWAEKDAWWRWEDEHPEVAEAITALVATVHFNPENCTDSVLTGGVQVEGIRLRVAELLGLHPPVDRMWPKI